jgi:hypothetical protein
MVMSEYIAVLTSIIIGLGMAQLLLGLIRMIQDPDQAKPYWIHLCWVCYMFIYAVFWWWWEFKLGGIEVWTFGVYLFVIFYAVLVFILCALLFPTDLSGYDGFKGYFYAMRGWFFGVFCFSEIIGLGDTAIKGMDYFHALGPQYLIALAFTITFSAIAIFTRNEKFHAIFALLALGYLIGNGLIDYQIVG